LFGGERLLVCNRHKGSDIGSIWRPAGDLIRFFNPRLDTWSDHFSLDGVVINPRTPIGQVTERIFKFNETERLLERETLRAVGRYPSEPASRQIAGSDRSA
jgi:hypothetical protein